MVSRDQIAQFHRDGFLIVTGLFSHAEIGALSAAGRSATGRGTGNRSILTIAALCELWSDYRIVEIVRALLAPHQLTFFGEANYARYLFDASEDMRGRHLHHDAKGTPEHLFNRVHAALPFTYPSVRVALYFQDFSARSGGLKLTPGSHQIETAAFSDTDFAHLNVPSQPGDAIFFTPRLLHSPFGMRLKRNPEHSLAPSEENSLMAMDPEQFLPWPLERESIFIDYVGDHELADLLIKSRALYPTSIKHGAVATFVQTLAIAERNNIRFRADHALVEAAIGASRNMSAQGLTEEGYRYLRAMPALCRQSESTSPYFPLFSAVPSEGNSEAIVAAANEVIESIRKYQATLATMNRDAHMNPYDFAS
jgi:hypothetical protein